MRNFLYDIKIFKSHEFKVPVISVGNITVGGTGKTPMTEFLVKMLKDEHKPAILSRGYKRKTKGFRFVKTNSTVAEVGDEPLQMKKKFKDVVVAVDANRVRGIQKIIDTHPEVTVILLDDAFQHRKVTPGFSILLSDYERPMLNDHFLPYGRLRESLHQIRRAHIIIITKTAEDIKPIDMRILSENYKIKPYQALHFSTFEYDELLPVFAGKNIFKTLDIIKKEGSSILMLTGVANPTPLEEHLKKYDPNLKTIAFSDHHDFSERDIQKIKEVFNSIENKKKFIITTEKDTLRLRAVEKHIDSDLKPIMYYIPVRVKYINPTTEEFRKQINKYVKTSRSNTKFFSGNRDF